MQITLLKSKIHRAIVTEANLSYEGSISIDTALCDLAHLRNFERVEIYNCNNGNRFATYVIPGKPGQICLNGAAARMVQPGDSVIIASYVTMTEDEANSFKPQLVFVDDKNAVSKITTDPA